MEYRPVERVCPTCGVKHWEHSAHCASCESAYQREEHY